MDIPKRVKNQPGREKYKAAPLPQPIPELPITTILINDLSDGITQRYASVVRKGIDPTTQDDIITFISNINLTARNFLALHSNDVLHDETIYAYLKLL